MVVGLNKSWQATDVLSQKAASTSSDVLLPMLLGFNQPDSGQQLQ
jgi:hypothetical protein